MRGYLCTVHNWDFCPYNGYSFMRFGISKAPWGLCYSNLYISFPNLLDLCKAKLRAYLWVNLVNSFRCPYYDQIIGTSVLVSFSSGPSILLRYRHTVKFALWQQNVIPAALFAGLHTFQKGGIEQWDYYEIHSVLTQTVVSMFEREMHALWYYPRSLGNDMPYLYI